MKEIVIDGDSCIHCGLCCAMYADNFELDKKTGNSIVKSNEGATEEMVGICPAGAISIQEKDNVSEFPTTNQEEGQDKVA